MALTAEEPQPQARTSRGGARARLSWTLLACMACSSSPVVQDPSPVVQDVVLTGAPTELADWEAWTLDTDRGVLAAAPTFGRQGVTVDLASGLVRQSGDATLFDSDKPLWFDRGSGMCSDGGATLVSCANETGFHREAASLARLAPGAIAMLARDGDGHVRLTAWSGTAEAWRYAPESAADAGGVVVAADGLSLAIVAAPDDGPTSVAMLDPATGVVRCSEARPMVDAGRLWGFRGNDPDRPVRKRPATGTSGLS